MSMSPVTLPLEPNPVLEVVEPQNEPAVQETVVQSNPTVGEVTVQTTTELQPTESSATAIQTMEEATQILQQTQLQEQILEGESVSLIASETGQSVNQVDNELGIPAATAAAIATYEAVPEVTGPGTTAQSQPGVAGSTLSVEI